jgi:RNA recognition motif-containing protein
MSRDADARGRAVYVGNLPLDASSRDVDRRFAAHGVVARVEVKRPRHPPAFAFVTFDDARDAERAARAEDGTTFDGRRVRAELARGRRDGGRERERERDGEARGDWDRGDRDDGDGRDRYAGRMRSDREGPYDRPRWRDGADARSTVRERAATRKTEHSVKVEDLPRGADWRDVKDAFRRAGRVTYASTFVDRDGRRCAEVHFESADDVERAIDAFDDREFEISGGAREYVRVFRRAPRRRREGGHRPRSYSRERYSDDRVRRARSRSRSFSRSFSRSRSRSRDERDDGPSRSPSPEIIERRRSRSRTPSRRDDDSPRRGRSPTPRGARSREPSFDDLAAND